MKLFEKYRGDQELDAQEMDQISKQLINAGLDFQKKEAWAKKLAEEHGFERPSAAKTMRLVPILLKIAAGFILLASIYFLWPNSPAPNSLQAQLALHLEEDALPHSAVRKGPSELENLQQSFIDAYNTEDYTKAVALGKQLIEHGAVKSNENSFYLALSHFYLKNYEQARSLLAPLQASIPEGRPFKQESKWFLSLAYLKLGEMEQAEPLLQEIQTAGGWKSEAARQLLDLRSK